MESLKHDLNLSDGKIDYFEPSETKEGFEYWDERLKILEA